MSDFKFSCPKCGQHIVCDTSNAGMQIPCPACQTPFTVPTPPPAVPSADAPGKLSINKTVSHAPASAHAAPATVYKPPGAIHSQPAASGGSRTSGLAIASLVCGLLGCIGCIPAIICGHMSRAKIAKDPSLKGRGLALTGLILGYLSIAGTIAYLAIIVPMAKQAFEKVKQQQQEEANRQEAEQKRLAAENAKPKAVPVSWTLDLSNAKIPDRPASGKLNGQNFTVEKATFQGGGLTLQQASGLSSQFVISPLKPAEITSYEVTAENPTNAPRVVLNWKETPPAKPGMATYTKDYVMMLEFTSVTPGKVSGKIYLCIPDDSQSFVAGTFETGPKAAPQPGAKPPGAAPRRKRTAAPAPAPQ